MFCFWRLTVFSRGTFHSAPTLECHAAVTGHDTPIHQNTQTHSKPIVMLLICQNTQTHGKPISYPESFASSKCISFLCVESDGKPVVMLSIDMEYGTGSHNHPFKCLGFDLI